MRTFFTQLCWLQAIVVFCLGSRSTDCEAAESRPNIVWLTSEDHGPHMGCYGDTYATTPNVDALAAKGMLYTHCWSNAPVCAPARTTLISGLYASSTGAEHMRSMVTLPAGLKLFPKLLRAAGYYCTNNVKEDYNVQQPGQLWDESSRMAHWQRRGEGQPFFAVFNSEKSHESKMRARPHTQVHDPAQVRVPAYHPDTPEVRRDWAQYYDVVSEADADAGARLQELAAAGLAEDTIVFYFADHGSGMPRNKRWLYNSGLQVPLVVYIPEKFAGLRSPDYVAGGKSDRLVSFVDFAPTVLSLAGIEPPAWLQGHAFLGPYAAPPQPFIYGFRGRMDERPDMLRSVTDGRFVYIRNYMPHKIYGQYLAYMFQTPTTQIWHALHQQGRLDKSQDLFWNTKPPEELYDLTTDRDEVNNLATLPEHQDTLARLRRAQQLRIRTALDIGFLPEAEMHSRSRGSTPLFMGRDDAHYPLERIVSAAELASSLQPDAIAALIALLGDSDSAVRYWAVLGLLMREGAGVGAGREALSSALDDSSPSVRVAAAEALGRYGSPEDSQRALATLCQLADGKRQNVFVVMAALNALDALGEPGMKAKATLGPAAPQMQAPHARYREYVPRLLESPKSN